MIILWIIGYITMGLVVTVLIKKFTEEDQPMDPGTYWSFVIFWPLGLFFLIILLLIKFCEWMFKKR